MSLIPADAGSRWFRERLASLPVDAGREPARTAVIESATLPAGTMPPLHVRDRDETYHVLNGAVTFYVGEEVVTASAGEVAVAPAGVLRTYRVTSETARWLVLTTLDSLARYEDFMRAVARGWDVDAVSDGVWPSEDEAFAVAAIAAANGIDVVGPPGMRPCDLGLGVCA
jgi:quercetin dioxygenase-like cupin family protein